MFGFRLTYSIKPSSLHFTEIASLHCLVPTSMKAIFQGYSNCIYSYRMSSSKWIWRHLLWKMLYLPSVSQKIENIQLDAPWSASDIKPYVPHIELADVRRLIRCEGTVVCCNGALRPDFAAAAYLLFKTLQKRVASHDACQKVLSKSYFELNESHRISFPLVVNLYVFRYRVLFRESNRQSNPLEYLQDNYLFAFVAQQ